MAGATWNCCHLRVLCPPYTHAPCHFMQSYICKGYACLSVTCYLHFWQNDRGLLLWSRYMLEYCVSKHVWCACFDQFYHLSDCVNTLPFRKKRKKVFPSFYMFYFSYPWRLTMWQQAYGYCFCYDCSCQRTFKDTSSCTVNWQSNSMSTSTSTVSALLLWKKTTSILLFWMESTKGASPIQLMSHKGHNHRDGNNLG